MTLLANENFPLFSIRLLRNAGYDILSILEKNPGASDLEILKQAQEENRIIMTFDRDYGELIYRYKLSVPGVLYFRFDPSTPKEPADVLLKILKENRVVIRGKFTVVKRDGIRQRNLSI